MEYTAVPVDRDARLLSRIVHTTNVAASAHDALQEALRLMCEHTGYAIGHAIMLRTGTDEAVSMSVWHGADTDACAEFRRASDLLVVQAGEGIVGHVLEGHVPLHIADVTEEPRYLRRSAARSAGLRGCVAIPIVAGHHALAAVELYAREARTLDDDTLELMAACGVALGRAVERHRVAIELDKRDAALLEEARARELALAREQSARQAAEIKADELARLTRELERSNRELDQFAYVASHDLKAPLRGIANLTGWLEEDLGNKLDDESRKHLALMRGRVVRMESLINGLLDYSRVGRIKHASTRVALRALIDEVIDLLAPDPIWRIDIAEGMPELIAPRLLLQQVLHNLIGNAFKHGRSADPRLSIDVRDLGSHYELCIADNGPGIDHRYHARIWEIFQTLQARDKVEGTGIGLAQVKKIVEHHGGSVGVDSHSGTGATFFFQWPKEPR